ncbi:MAG: hypothetical protein KDD50_03860 [Bdellovibrionales bacterium]|nr:hypothetical protein [Bdellovibrionales bacterium]
MRIQCFHCLKLIDVPKDIGRREECPECGADLHVCRNCRFYDEKAYNECVETSADVVREKDRANFCDFFELNTEAKAADEKDKLKAAAEALFKK